MKQGKKRELKNISKVSRSGFFFIKTDNFLQFSLRTCMFALRGWHCLNTHSKCVFSSLKKCKTQKKIHRRKCESFTPFIHSFVDSSTCFINKSQDEKKRREFYYYEYFFAALNFKVMKPLWQKKNLANVRRSCY